jgi:peptidoglycan/LPS O-acetylase OafA/YrhL
MALGLINVSIFGQDDVMFLALHSGQVHFAVNFRISELPLYQGLLVPQAWTLGLELCFYTLAPLIVIKAWRVWIALAISVSVRMTLIFMGLAFQDPWSYRFFPSELMWFMLGALSMRLLLPRWETFLDQKPRLTSLLVFSVLVLLALYQVLPGQGDPGDLKSMMFIGLIVLFMPAMFVFQKQSPFDKQIGELSYPIYICHMLVISLASATLTRYSLNQGTIAAVTKLTSVIIAAYALNRFVAMPLEKVRVRFRRPILA